MRVHLGKLVIPIEALPFMLVQDTQLPQRVKADDPYRHLTHRQCCVRSLWTIRLLPWLQECHFKSMSPPLLCFVPDCAGATFATRTKAAVTD